LHEDYDVRLLVRVEDSPINSRIGELLFNDGTSRNNSFSSVSISRTMHMADEVVLVSLEVHLGAGFTDRLIMSEIMIDPASGGPEWIEYYNPDQFAVNLSGWSISRISNGVVSAHELITSGVVPGESFLLFSGNPSIQTDLGAELVLDLGVSGVLGSGQIDALESDGGQILIQYAEYNTALTYDLIDFEWDSTWNINSGYSLVWNSGEFSNSSSWILLEDGTPGGL